MPTEAAPLAMTEIVSGTWLGTWQTPLSGTIKSFFATYAKDPAIRQQAIQDISYSQMAETVKVSSFARTTTSGVGTTLDWARVQEGFLDTMR